MDTLLIFIFSWVWYYRQTVGRTMAFLVILGHLLFGISLSMISLQDGRRIRQTNFSLIILVSFPKFNEIPFDLLKSPFMASRLYILGTHNDHGVWVWFLFWIQQFLTCCCWRLSLYQETSKLWSLCSGSNYLGTGKICLAYSSSVLLGYHRQTDAKQKMP